MLEKWLFGVRCGNENSFDIDVVRMVELFSKGVVDLLYTKTPGCVKL